MIEETKREFCFLFYPKEAMQDIAAIDSKTKLAYFLILCDHVPHGFCPNRRYNHFTQDLSDAQKEDLGLLVSAIEGGYFIPWVREQYLKRQSFCDSRRKSSLSKKDKNANNIRKPYEDRMVIVKEKEIVIEEVVEDKKAKVEIWPSFEDFWLAYDYKKDRSRAKKVWDALSQKDKEAAIDGVQSYKEDVARRASILKYPKTYLNGKNWEDEYYEPIKTITNNNNNNGGKYDNLKRKLAAELSN